MTVQDLIECLETMPKDLKVFWWLGDKRVEVFEVRNCEDCVDLYENDIRG